MSVQKELRTWKNNLKKYNKGGSVNYVLQVKFNQLAVFANKFLLKYSCAHSFQWHLWLLQATMAELSNSDRSHMPSAPPQIFIWHFMEFSNIWTKEKILTLWIQQGSISRMRSGMADISVFFHYMLLPWILYVKSFGTIQSDSVN